MGSQARRSLVFRWPLGRPASIQALTFRHLVVPVQLGSSPATEARDDACSSSQDRSTAATMTCWYGMSCCPWGSDDMPIQETRRSRQTAGLGNREMIINMAFGDCDPRVTVIGSPRQRDDPGARFAVTRPGSLVTTGRHLITQESFSQRSETCKRRHASMPSFLMTCRRPRWVKNPIQPTIARRRGR